MFGEGGERCDTAAEGEAFEGLVEGYCYEEDYEVRASGDAECHACGGCKYHFLYIMNHSEEVKYQ